MNDQQIIRALKREKADALDLLDRVMVYWDEGPPYIPSEKYKKKFRTAIAALKRGDDDDTE